MRLLLLLMALFSCSGAWGEADIELSVSFIGGNFVPPGEPASVEFRWVNNGPDPAENVVAATFYYVGAGKSTLSIGPNSQTFPCKVRIFAFDGAPGSPIAISAKVISDRSTLQPGEVAVCIVGLVTYPDSPALIAQIFSAYPQDGDPDVSNNSATLRVFTGNGLTAVPAGGMGIWSVLIVALMILGLRRIRVNMASTNDRNT